MSLKLERWMRSLITGKWGRWVMLGLLIAILSGFTVMSEIGDWLFGRNRGGTQEDVAGSFAVLPGAVTEVDYKSFDAARRRFGLARQFLQNVPRERVPDIDVWTYLVLLKAAEREHITVSADDLRKTISRVLPDYIVQDPAQYRNLVQERLGVTVPTLEASLREFLTALRVRELYAESFLTGPAATREQAVEQAASQNIEYAFGDYAALDVERFIAEAEDELKSEADPEAKLREFYDKDPSLALDPERFRHPRRFRLEILYSIHSNVDTDEKLDRIKDVVSKAYPEAKFPEPTVGDRRTYYGTYTNRLLSTAGETLASITKKVQEEGKEEEKPDTPPDEPKEGGDKDADKDADADKDNDPDKEKSKPDEPLSPAMRDKINAYGYEIVKEQVGREVTLRTIYEFLHTQSRDGVSLKEMFDRLKAQDDPENPVCSTEPGKGLIVYRDFEGNPLTTDDLKAIEDSGVKFGFSFVPRVTGLGDTDLPKMSRKADTLGDEGHGRQIFRLLEVIREQRKTFDELTAGEKEELKKLFYLPARARERAKEKLESLRQALVSGEAKPEEFREKAEALGCRVHEGEWIEASYNNLREPDEERLWPAEYLHMRDRHFLRRSLAQVLDRDRAKPEDKREWNPPCYLPVDVDTRGGVKEPGAAYLFHLRERKRPDAMTITASEMSRYLRTFVSQRMYEEQQRWTDDPQQVKEDFRMVFDKDMQARFDEDMQRREEARRKGRR